MLRRTELAQLVQTYRHEWSSAQQAKIDILVDWMVDHTKLHQLSIHSEIRRRVTRYVWGEADSLEIAASLAPRGYICHATAASIHGLLSYNPETIYVNREQSAKPALDGPLSQEGVNRAFAKKQRTSQDVYSWGTTRIAILSGKNSGGLGVQEHSLGSSPSVRRPQDALRVR